MRHSTSRRYDGPAVMLRKVNDPLGEGWVLYSRLVEERIKRVLGGRTAGVERWPFGTIDPVMSRPSTSAKREARRKRPVRVMAGGRGDDDEARKFCNCQ